MKDHVGEFGAKKWHLSESRMDGRDDVVLINFSVANFRSFKDEQTISLAASRVASHPDNVIEYEGGKVLKAAAIYGANASGKSNFLGALDCMVNFIRHSATRMNEGDEIPRITPFRLHPKTPSEPSVFSISFTIGEDLFAYGFSASRTRVCEEWLIFYPPKGRQQRWLHRRLDPETSKTSWRTGGPLVKHRRLLKERTRSNGLALSRGAELNIPELSRIYIWSRSIWTFDLAMPPSRLFLMTARKVLEEPKFRSRIVKLLRDADMAIFDVIVDEEPIPSKLREVLPEKLKSEKLVVPTITAIHMAPGLKDPVHMDMEDDESNGTQRFFSIAGPVLDALENGAAVVVDELECSMHPLLSRKLIELFQSPKMNRKGAQLIFATHDVTLMDHTLLRPDQIWTVEKRSDGSSELGSLMDIDECSRPRSSERFQRRYLAGRYGGVPSFGPSLEDLDLP